MATTQSDDKTRAPGTADHHILRDLVKQYLEVCNDPGQEEKRERWKSIHALSSDQPAVFTRPFLMMHEVPDVNALQCENPLLRGVERNLRQCLFLSTINDDTVFEPFLNVRAVFKPQGEDLWGIPLPAREQGPHKASNVYEDAPMKSLEDIHKLRSLPHEIDEQATEERKQMVLEAVDGLIPVNVVRQPRYGGGPSMLIPRLTLMRGMTQLMLDMHDNPEWLHSVLAFMRDTVLSSFEQAEKAGDWHRADSGNQAMPYACNLPDPEPGKPAQMNELWGFMHAQEYTLVSPDMHEEFGLRYQKPIMEKFGLTAYGCCEDLTQKIDMLRQVTNLRRIAVTPRADVVRCAEQIGRDYTISWRPNPAEMVCCGFDEEKIERKLTEGVRALKGLHYDITLVVSLVLAMELTQN